MSDFAQQGKQKSGRPNVDNRKRPPSPALMNSSTIEGTVDLITWQSEETHFTIARMIAPKFDSEKFTIKGTFPELKKGETLRVEGEWIEDRKYGWNFSVKNYVPIVSDDPEMLQVYLGSGMIKGVGPATAKKIVAHFGAETVRILDEQPERLDEVSKLSKKLIPKIGKAWKEQRDVHEIMVFLQGHGISPKFAQRLHRHYGDDTVRVIKINPYRISWEVNGFSFIRADEIADGFGIEKDSPNRIVGAFHHLLMKASEEGHTCLPQEGIIDSAVQLLGIDAHLVEQIYNREISDAKRMQAFTRRDGQSYVAMKSMYRSESGVARLLGFFIRNAQPLMRKGIEKRVSDFQELHQFQLAAEQKEAIHQIASGGVSVITGGPGTGKTTLIRALLWCLQPKNSEHGVKDSELALCSPTGRAAQRMSESTGKFATTIHRLLKYNPQEGGFVQREDNPIPVKLLIVDEASMLDIPLAYHLLRALTPGTAVVFVGDIDQLPSVGAGSFLEDVINSGRARVTRLNVIFRQAQESAIIRNAHRINEGRQPEQPEPPKGTESKKLSDFYIIAREEAEATRDALIEVVTNRIPKKFHFDPVRDVQVLSPMRRGMLGTELLNGLLQEKLNADSKAWQIGSMSLRVGDKVIQSANNYDLNVFNGDIGFVERISRDQLTFSVRYGTRPVEYQWGEIDQISLAYAITIHKSQGSEYPVTVLVLHNQHFTMLQRRLLYTGVTRGKKLVLLIGSKKAIQMAVRNIQDTPRLTSLAEWMCFPPDGDGDELL